MITAVAQAQPRDLYVRAGHSRQAVIYTNRGNDLFDKNDFEGALRNFDLAIRLDHTMWPAYYNRARVFMKQHKWKKVIQDENAVIRIKPSFLWATVMRGSANLRLGNYSSSLADFENVLTLHPDAEVRAVALNNRAWLRAVCPDPSFRNGPQAVADASRACAMSQLENRPIRRDACSCLC